MKQLSKILSFLMLLFLLTAETCNESNVQITREEKQSGIFQEIENEFENEELTPEALLAFEKRIIQKVGDLTDYMNIYGDPSLTNEFRIHARNMMKEIFNSEADIHNYFENLTLFEDTINSKLCYFENSGSFKTTVDSIIIIQHFQQKTNSSFSGEIQFSQKLFSITALDTVFIHSYNQGLKTIVLKTEKKFGEKLQSVWEVYLGEIK